MPLQQGLRELLGRRGVPGWIVTVISVMLFFWNLANHLSTGSFVVQVIDWLSDPKNANALSSAVDLFAKWAPLPIFVLGFLWLFYVATHPKTVTSVASTESVAPSHAVDLESPRPTPIAPAMALYDGSIGAIIHDPTLERVRDLYPFLKDAVFAANDFFSTSFDRVGLDPGVIGRLFLNLLDAYVRCDALLGVGRLERSLEDQELAETIESKLKRGLLAYGAFASYIHRAGPIMASEEHFYGSPGYARLHNAHRDLLVELKSIRGRFDWISEEIGNLQSFFAAPPRER